MLSWIILCWTNAFIWVLLLGQTGQVTLHSWISSIPFSMNFDRPASSTFLHSIQSWNVNNVFKEHDLSDEFWKTLFTSCNPQSPLHCNFYSTVNHHSWTLSNLFWTMGIFVSKFMVANWISAQRITLANVNIWAVDDPRLLLISCPPAFQFLQDYHLFLYISKASQR